MQNLHGQYNYLSPEVKSDSFMGGVVFFADELCPMRETNETNRPMCLDYCCCRTIECESGCGNKAKHICCCLFGCCCCTQDCNGSDKFCLSSKRHLKSYKKDSDEVDIYNTRLSRTIINCIIDCKDKKVTNMDGYIKYVFDAIKEEVGKTRPEDELRKINGSGYKTKSSIEPTHNELKNQYILENYKRIRDLFGGEHSKSTFSNQEFKEIENNDITKRILETWGLLCDDVNKSISATVQDQKQIYRGKLQKLDHTRKSMCDAQEDETKQAMNGMHKYCQMTEHSYIKVNEILQSRLGNFKCKDLFSEIVLTTDEWKIIYFPDVEKFIVNTKNEPIERMRKKRVCAASACKLSIMLLVPIIIIVALTIAAIEIISQFKKS